MRWIWALLALIFCAPLPGQLITRLTPESAQAFDAYVKDAEAHMDWRPRMQPGGDVHVGPAANKTPRDAPESLIHDWIAAMIVPRAQANKAIALLQDYENYKSVYAPDVRESRLLSRSGGHFYPFLKLHKKSVIPVVLDSEYDVEFKSLAAGRWAVVSHSTKISEVDGTPLAEGTGHGFLWRLNSYWLIEQRGESVYMECRTISLTRDIPVGLGWVLRPVLNNLPRESLKETLEATARALR